ncbi:MAG TPA: zinc-dependent metalloprotease, partial [Acidobacteriaceae bacterium]
GGLDYRYSLRGDGQSPPKNVSGAEQRKALAAVLRTLDAGTLTLPPQLLATLPPRPPGYPATRESFATRTGLTFDPQAAVASAAEITASLLFEPTRAARLLDYNSRDRSLPGLDEVLHQVLASTWFAPRLDGQAALTQATVEDVVLRHLLALAANEEESATVRDMAAYQVRDLKSWLQAHTGDSRPLEAAHRAGALQQIGAFEKDPSRFAAPAAPAVPPGQPIGDDE